LWRPELALAPRIRGVLQAAPTCTLLAQGRTMTKPRNLGRARLVLPFLSLLSACSGEVGMSDAETLAAASEELFVIFPPLPLFDRGWDEDTNLPGSTFRTFSASPDEPATCANACDRDASCRAFTYDPNGSAAGRCELKSSVPTGVAATGKVSGVKGRVERGYKRTGNTYAEVVVPARGDECRAACLRDSRCKAFSLELSPDKGVASICKLQDTIVNPTVDLISFSGVRQQNLGFDLQPDRGGTLVSALDNPVLSGLVPTKGLTIEANSRTSTVGPHPIILRSNAGGVFPDGDRGYTFLAPPSGDKSRFLPVRVSLPSNGAAIDFSLTELTGTLNERVFGTMRVALAPNVLVVPVDPSLRRARRLVRRRLCAVGEDHSQHDRRRPCEPRARVSF
jgi:hypothetical protein